MTDPATPADELEISIDQLKVREIEEIEELAGVSLDELFGDGKPKGKALRIVGYIVKKRDNPNFSMDDAGELVIKLAESAPLENGS